GRYHDEHRSSQNRALMVVEVQLIAGWVMETGLKPIEADELILQPVGCELLRLYGYEVGPRLYAEFLKAFEDPPRAGAVSPAHAQARDGVFMPPTAAASVGSGNDSG